MGGFSYSRGQMAMEMIMIYSFAFLTITSITGYMYWSEIFNSNSYIPEVCKFTNNFGEHIACKDIKLARNVGIITLFNGLKEPIEVESLTIIETLPIAKDLTQNVVIQPGRQADIMIEGYDFKGNKVIGNIQVKYSQKGREFIELGELRTKLEPDFEILPVIAYFKYNHNALDEINGWDCGFAGDSYYSLDAFEGESRIETMTCLNQLNNINSLSFDFYIKRDMHIDSGLLQHNLYDITIINDRLRFGMYLFNNMTGDVDWKFITGNTQLETGNWDNVWIRFSNHKMYIYINNELDKEVAFDGYYMFPLNGAAVVNSPDTKIDELKIYGN